MSSSPSKSFWKRVVILLGRLDLSTKTGNILHRDISENNIIITDAENEGDPRGMLIDLDLAQELDSGSSGARYRTGTMEFMALKPINAPPKMRTTGISRSCRRLQLLTTTLTLVSTILLASPAAAIPTGGAEPAAANLKGRSAFAKRYADTPQLEGSQCTPVLQGLYACSLNYWDIVSGRPGEVLSGNLADDDA